MSPNLSIYNLTRPTTQQAAAEREEWRDRAACAGQGDYPWFGGERDHGSQTIRREAEAADICAACPVVTECLTAALKVEGDGSVQLRFGVVGGMNPAQRYALSNGRPVPPLPRPRVKATPAAPAPAAAPAPVDPRPIPADCEDPSDYGANRHFRRGERPCVACAAAKAAAKRRQRAAARAANDQTAATA